MFDQARPRQRHLLFRLSHRCGGFTVSVAGSWVLSRGDSHDPSCVAFPKTSRPPAVLPVCGSPIGRLPILVIRLVTSFLPLQWQQFDEW